MQSDSADGAQEQPKRRRPLRRSPLRRISRQTRKRNLAGRQAAAWLAGQHANPVCGFPHVRAAYEHGLTVPCTGNSGLDPHHKIFRSADPNLVDDPDNIVLVCRAAHDAIHANPNVARQLGFYNNH